MSTPIVNKWVTCHRPQPEAKLRLFCFPYAGGGASVYHRWAGELSMAAEVCALQLPGRETRIGELAFDRIEPLIEEIGRAILPHLDRPFIFYGHSMGAKIGFELTRLLRRELGVLPSHLFVSGCRAPHLPRRRQPIYELPDPEFIEELRRLNGTPAEVLAYDDLMRLMMPMLRADIAICDTYRYSPGRPLDCPITAFGGLQDPDVCRQDLEGWREHTNAAFNLHMFPGGHFFNNESSALLLRTLFKDLHQLSRAIV